MALTTTTQKAGTNSTETVQNTENVTQNGTENTESNQEKLQLQITDSGTSSKSTLVIETPKTGNTPQTKITTSDESYTGIVTWNPADRAFAAGTSYQADVTLYATEKYIFEVGSISQVQTGLVSGINVSSDGKTLSFRLTFSATEKEVQTDDTKNNQANSGTQPDSNTQNSSESSKGNEDKNTGETKTPDNAQSSDSNSKTTGNQSTGKSGGSGSVISTGSSSGGSSSLSYGTEESSESDEIIAFTLASNENMKLVVSVDELDINSVAKDQEAEVTLDAIEGETFTGTVTKHPCLTRFGATINETILVECRL